MKILRFNSIEIRAFYDGRFQANYDKFSSELNGVLGANASGKSTLAKAAMWILNPELAKGNDRVCAELILDEDGTETAFHADVDRKTKDAPWPQSRRPDLYRLALDDLMTGPGKNDTRVIREAFAGGVDLRGLFPYVNKRPPQLAGVGKGIAEREQEAARIADQEAQCENHVAKRQHLRQTLREREQLKTLCEARQAAHRSETLASERQAILDQFPGIDRQPEDALSRVEQARDRLQRLREEHENARHKLAPFGERTAPNSLPAATRAHLLAQSKTLDQYRQRCAQLETEYQTQLRTVRQRIDEAGARLNRWELTLPESYHPTDELAVLKLLDTEHLPGLQDQLRQHRTRKEALETEAALRESTPVLPNPPLLGIAALATAGLLGYSLYAYLKNLPETPYLLTLSLGTLALTTSLALLRKQHLGKRSGDVQRLRQESAAIETQLIETQLQELSKAFQEATGIQLDTGYTLDLATRRAREVCEARLALYRALEDHERLLQKQNPEIDSLQTHMNQLRGYEANIEAELAATYKEYEQAQLIPANGTASESLKVFLEWFDLSDLVTRAGQRVQEGERELSELLDRFGAPKAEEIPARIDHLRDRLAAAKTYRNHDANHALAQQEAKTLQERVALTPEQLQKLGLNPNPTVPEIQVVLEPMSELESELETLDKSISDIRTQVGVLESGGGKTLDDWNERIGEVETFLQSFIERRAGFLVREALEAAVRRENTPEVVKGLETWLHRFTGGRYIRPEVHDGELVITDVQSNNTLHTLDQLSTGTRVHLALAVRLAVIETTETQGIRFPLFLDDILAVSDPEALSALRQALHEIRQTRQLFLLTPHPADLEGLNATVITCPKKTAVSEVRKTG